MERAIAMAEDGVNTGSVSETVAWRNKWIASEWGDQIIGEYTKECLWQLMGWRRSLTLKTFLTLTLNRESKILFIAR
jgi:hypothetical protein